MVALAIPQPARAPASTAVWYGEGHRLVAGIAERRLAPHTIEAVRDLLGGAGLVAAATWADRIEDDRPETKPLHYVNIPLDAAGYDPVRDCPHGRCLIAAIERDRKVLADSAASRAERAEALRFLVHFIGDLHQPLHVSNNADRGGNRRQVVFLGSPTNLHAVWDGDLIQSARLDEPHYLTRLLRKMDSLDLGALERGTIVDWAMEGHRLAAEQAYRLPAGGQIGRKYRDANLAAVDLALIEAGVRLARVLNEALAGYRLAPGRNPPAVFRVYPDREAGAHIGEVATVIGTVASVHRSRSGNIFLDFGAAYPRQTFTAAVLRPTDPRLQSLDSLAGRRIGVKGRIRRYRGRAEIVIERVEQIEAGREE
jgi:hypothetical protein